MPLEAAVAASRSVAGASCGSRGNRNSAQEHSEAPDVAPRWPRRKVKVKIEVASQEPGARNQKPGVPPPGCNSPWSSTLRFAAKSSFLLGLASPVPSTVTRSSNEAAPDSRLRLSLRVLRVVYSSLGASSLHLRVRLLAPLVSRFFPGPALLHQTRLAYVVVVYNNCTNQWVYPSLILCH